MRKSSWLALVACSVAAVVVVLATCTPSNAAMPTPWHPHPMPHPWHPQPLPHPWHPHPLPHALPFGPVFGPVVVVRTPAYPVVSLSPVTSYAPAAINPLPAIVPVAVLNPADTGATLSFTIDGTQYDLSPGMRQEFRFAGTRTIQFDRGGSFGRARYRLSKGLYTFTATDGGWDLKRLPYQPAVDSQ